ncbi:hypothetical protein [uncultured Salinicola sp.]|uniref:hypothetical protein n=1 Tax=uncultured Salinicola sp. TaxID=1193542 RepID=UPI0026375C85|nr:hypothetical protein [uncultured Salinicola sp.]
MKRFTFLIGVAAAALATTTPAIAQEVVMRRPLIVPTKGAEWRVSPFLIYDTNGNVVQPQNACGPYEERRDVQCVVNERPVGDSYCRDVGPKPEGSKQSFIDTGCSYDWYQGQWQDPGPSCSNAEAQERVVECRRSYDDVKVADSLCSGTKPTTERTVVDHSTCTYSWNSSDPFADPGQNCTATEEWTRDVFCERDLDKVQVADGQCGGSKPATVDVREDYSSCSYSWKNDQTFTDPGDSCTSEENQTRAVWCERDLDGNVEQDAKCDGATRPAASQTVEDFSGCDYEWKTGAWQDPGASCTSTERQTRSVTCLRSDGTTVTEGCDASDRPAASQDVADYSNCSYNWIESGYGAWTSTCSNSATRSQTVNCRRSDGTIMTGTQESLCSGTKPAQTEGPTGIYSTCGYTANYGAWGACDGTSRSRTMATCTRSTGDNVALSNCTSRGDQLTQTESCVTYAWVAGTWNAWGNTCTANSTRTQNYYCRASNGQTVADGNCTGPKPTNSETAPNYTGCTYTLVDSGTGACDGTQRPHYWGCRRDQTGEMVYSGTYCGRENPTYEACQTYAWEASTWNGWNSTCSSNATRTQNFICRASNGSVVADGNCAGPKPTNSETGPNYSSCTYTASYTGWGACDGTNQTRSMNLCTRNQTGESVAGEYCVNQGYPWTQSQNCYSYQWVPGAWQDPGASCTPSETQTRSVICRRSDGATVGDASCGGGKPATTQTIEDYSGCTPTANLTVNWGGWSWNNTCSSSATRTRSGTCLASGTPVDSSVCTSRGVAVTESVTEANYASCTYSWQYGAWSNWSSTCSASATHTRSVWCRRNQTGETVTDGYCGGGKPATSETSPNYSNCASCQSVGSYGGGGDTCEGGTVIATGESFWSRDQSGRQSSSQSGMQDSLSCVRAGGNCWQEYVEQHSEYGEWEEVRRQFECHRGATSISPNGSHDGYGNSYSSDLYNAGYIQCTG